MTAAVYADKPKCPRCGHAIVAPANLDLVRDGDATDVECHRCRLAYRVTLSIEPEYVSEPLEAL